MLPAHWCALAEEHTVKRIGRGTAIDSRRIAHTCIDYVYATQRIPSIGELCLTAHVSERRLSEAFVDEFSQAPSRFFRDWALQRARLRLRTGEPSRITVSRIANDLGFFHLGRFAGRYRELFGETPSATLRAPARRVA
jgi:AraC-like DNA-binding protein